MSRTWFAERAVTGARLHPDLPVDGAPTRALSATGSVTFDVTQDLAGYVAEDGRPLFDKWGTLMYLEEGERLRWGGIVIDKSEEGANIEVQAGSFMSYFFGQAWTGSLSLVNVDPVTAIRAIVDHVQSFPDGNLGIQVVGSTSVRIGVETKETTIDGVTTVEPVPYEFHWWDNGDCGQEIQRIIDQCAIEWTEEHYWIDRAAGTIGHRLIIADRIGGRREDLTFEQGVNIMQVPTFDEDGDEYASEIIALGAGEGKASLRSVAAVTIPGRLRRARVIDETKDIQTKARLDSVANMALRMMSGAMTTDEIEVMEHEHAPLGSWEIGDEILVTLRNAANDPVSRWYRIETEEMVSEMHVVLSLLPIY